MRRIATRSRGAGAAPRSPVPVAGSGSSVHGPAGSSNETDPALLAISIAGWLHHLTATRDEHGQTTGWGTRGGKAMIATLRHTIINTPARLVRHARRLTLRPPPGHGHLAEVLTRIRALPATP